MRSLVSLKGTMSRIVRPTSVRRADIDRLLVAQGAVASAQLRSLNSIQSLSDVEFSIFSQWGEDGIIEWITQRCGHLPEKFIEFGVEDYRESNTRFLISNRNWRGLIIDGSPANVRFIQADPISYQRDLTAKCEFITSDNIQRIISEAGFSGEIGVLSIDIDGNDYWIWKIIENVRPYLVIVEYNAVFGDLFDLSVPYDPSFSRTKAHHSNFYYGASIGALTRLGLAKGYTLLGSNRAGSNAFFIRDECASKFLSNISDRSARPSRFRESRSPDGELTFVRADERAKIIGKCEVVDTSSGRLGRLGSLGNLYSESWLSGFE